MKWILVYIVVQPFADGLHTSYEPYAINPMGPRVLFDSMTDCFYAREELGGNLSGSSGHFEVGSQAVCIPVDK
jgi:hypothetical protein|tara:strand:- start:295 stop:513 length:219 start_codon:yes stop_codon:yes gene_type:complete